MTKIEEVAARAEAALTELMKLLNDVGDTPADIYEMLTTDQQVAVEQATYMARELTDLNDEFE